MDVNEMTPTQLRELAAKKEKEASERISHVGYLKMDLFDFDAPTGLDSYGETRYRFCLKPKNKETDLSNSLKKNLRW